MTEKRKIKVALVAAGKYHDIDFARLEILKLLAEDERVRVRVFEDYSNIAAIRESDFLVTYTCDVMPRLDEQEVLRAYVEGGGRWYALHGTNSILRFLADGRVDSPRWAPHFMETLGSMFIAHPPIAPYRVTIADPSHPLVKDVKPFETNDELYLSETYGKLHVLLETEFEGEATGFVEKDWKKAKHPVFYLHPVGEGAVLYLTLGHCRGHYDMQPLMDFYPQVERCAWDLPVFYDLLRRGISWAKERGGMTTYIHVTLEVEAAGMARFIETMGEAVSLLEGWGWRLHGAFIQRTGKLNTVIDVWELENFAHFDLGLQKFRVHPRFATIKKALDETVKSETIVFADRLSYMR